MFPQEGLEGGVGEHVMDLEILSPSFQNAYVHEEETGVTEDEMVGQHH